MKMDVEVQRRAKSLDEGNCTRPGRGVRIACFLDQMRGNDAMDDAQHATHDLGPAGEQETQLEWKTRHPLAHGLFGKYFINQQGRALRHPPCPAARAEAPSFTAESNQVLGVTRLAAHPQKAVFQPAAFEVVLEFSLYIARQFPSLLH